MKKLLLLLLLPITACASRIEKVIALSEPKTVKIGIVQKDGESGVCSGAFITKDGIILTCAHCFQDKEISKVFVKTSDGQVYSGMGAVISEKMDLALIIADLNGRIVPFFKLGKNPSIGQEVIALGSPLGIQGVATVGRVEKLLKEAYTFILHSAFINPGNSGGPLVNLHGELVGINEATLAINPIMAAQGLFVAVDVPTIKEFLYGRSN